MKAGAKLGKWPGSSLQQAGGRQRGWAGGLPVAVAQVVAGLPHKLAHARARSAGAAAAAAAAQVAAQYLCLLQYQGHLGGQEHCHAVLDGTGSSASDSRVGWGGRGLAGPGMA